MKTILIAIIAFFVLTMTCEAQWTTSGANIYNSNTGNVGIGTISPTVKLQTLSGTAGSMGFLYETGVLEKSGDNKLGVFCSLSSPVGTGGQA